MKHLVKDSNDFWRTECQSIIGSARYLADPPKYRKRTPIEQLLFRTRAMNYNAIPAAHALYPDSESIKNNSPERYFKYRLQNVLKNPSIIQFVGCVMAELDLNVIGPLIQKCCMNAMRSEWGPNCNPHWHSILLSEYYSKLFNEWVTKLSEEAVKIQN